MENVIQSNLHFRNAEFLTRPPEQGTKITFLPYLLLEIDGEVNQQYMREQKTTDIYGLPNSVRILQQTHVKTTFTVLSSLSFRLLWWGMKTGSGAASVDVLLWIHSSLQTKCVDGPFSIAVAIEVRGQRLNHFVHSQTANFLHAANGINVLACWTWS